MLFWNRRVVYHGFVVFEKGKISDILSMNHIKYVSKFVNKKNRQGYNKQKSHFEHFGLNINYEKEFYIYVAKKDYDRALTLLSSRT